MRVTIHRKIVLSFLVVAILLAVSGGLLFSNLNKMDESYGKLLEQDTQILLNVEMITKDTVQQTSSVQQYLLTRDSANIDRMKQASQEQIQRLYLTLELVTREEDKQSLNQLIALSRDFNLKADNIMTEADSDLASAVKNAAATLIPVAQQMESIADRIVKDQQQVLDTSSNQNSSTVSSLKTVSMIVIGFTFVLALVIGYFLARFICRPLILISKSAQQIAEGNLTEQEIRIKNRDEIGDLAVSFNQMRDNLRQLISEIYKSAEHVAASSQELAAGADQTSQTTEQIAASIQRVAEGTDQQVQGVVDCVQAVNEMSMGVQHISVNAQQVADAVVVTSEKSEEGNQAIQSAIQQMQSIHMTMDGLSKMIAELGERSKHIGKIVDLITNIAKQTNLLALNASIESARAGEHGKGFAVVANEVRNLAEQSSQSAKQIAEMVAAIQQDTRSTVVSVETGRNEVEEGIRIVNRAGEAFGHIQSSIDHVAEEIQLVSTRIQHMTQNAAQVVESIETISEMTERSVAESQTVSAATEEQLASMEEFASFVTSLSKMAEQLQEQTTKFRI
ncbi:methyl-accepting chemotaxis protein [Paenibacillus selenitireducens]|uniref:Methyl-accepting chemotaxis protein n=1 Tax=Paenibacillus selenitireducens TaxID=1324314 RepID=A0A1T2X8M6_9BACL|nr:methyl-accepting chemotaxis protein [Paenibacillus selenitireducens]OPA76175.1 methyl-accepting chemotaxis protein [Paenibacillus selenitireducens]